VDVDDLYGLPLDQFVPERTALARELRKAGERDRAGEVAALRKPSVAAWAVNQLVRSRRSAVGELLDAGEALRAAQDDVLAGRGDAGSLRAAVEHERAAVDALTDAARGLLSSEGEELSDTMIERVSDTLHAAALDDEARAQVEQGRLERELRHVGLGGFGAVGAGGAPAPRASRKKTDKDEKQQAGRREHERERTAREQERARTAREQERDRTAREQARAQEEARREARVAEREAKRRAERAERAAKLALERRDKAAEALREAEADLAAADAQLRHAEEAVREAETASRDAAR